MQYRHSMQRDCPTAALALRSSRHRWLQAAALSTSATSLTAGGWEAPGSLVAVLASFAKRSSAR